MENSSGVEGQEGLEEEEEEILPRDAKVIKTILRSMGVQQFEPRVVHQFLEFCYRYVLEVLQDAQAYSDHAGNPAIQIDDVKLAIQTRVNFSFSQPPPRETLMEMARLRNCIPLPKAINGPGIALPPEQDTLIAPNYQLAVPVTNLGNTEEGMEVDEEEENESEKEGDKEASQLLPSSRVDLDSARKVSFSLAGQRPRV